MYHDEQARARRPRTSSSRPSWIDAGRAHPHAPRGGHRRPAAAVALLRHAAPSASVEAIGLPADDVVVRTVMDINAGVDGAFVASSGKNMGAFKGVGYPEEIADFFRLEEYDGHTWLGHNRFPTNTPGWWGGAHPFALLDWAVVHNGEISSYGINRRYLEQFGYRCALRHRHRGRRLPLRPAAAPPRPAARAGLPGARQPALERDRPHGRRTSASSRRRCARSTGRRMLNGPFAIVLGFDGGMVALNDRIKLRPLVAARQGSILMVASEESVLHEVLRRARRASGRRAPASPSSRACRRRRHRQGRRAGLRRRGRGAPDDRRSLVAARVPRAHRRRPLPASAAAACSSAAGASTRSTSAPLPDHARCRACHRCVTLLPGAAPSPSSRTRSPTARTPPGRRPCAAPPGGRPRPAACCSPAWATTGRTSTSSTTSCSTPARSPTRPSTRCASRWSCAPTSAASRTASEVAERGRRLQAQDDAASPPSIRLDTPIMFAPMSYGSVIAQRAQVAGAWPPGACGILMNTGEGGLHADLYPYEDNIIVQVASGRFGVDADYLNARRRRRDQDRPGRQARHRRPPARREGRPRRSPPRA